MAWRTQKVLVQVCYSRQYEDLVCGWYSGGKDDYVSGYSKEFPAHHVIMVDDGRDILNATRRAVNHVRTILVNPWGWGRAEWAGRHEYATDLYDLAGRLQSMSKALSS